MPCRSTVMVLGSSLRSAHVTTLSGSWFPVLRRTESMRATSSSGENGFGNAVLNRFLQTDIGEILRGVSKYGSDDDGCHDSVAPDFPDEVDSRSIGEHPVGNHDFRRIAMNLLKPVLFGRGNDHMMEMRG